MSRNWSTDKQMVGHPYNGVFPSSTRNQPLIHTTWMNLKGSTLSGRSPKRTGTRSVIPLTWHSRRDRTTQTETRSGVARGWKGGKGIDYKGTWGNFLEWNKYSISWLWWWLPDRLHLSKLIPFLCTSKVWITPWQKSVHTSTLRSPHTGTSSFICTGQTLETPYTSPTGEWTNGGTSTH